MPEKTYWPSNWVSGVLLDAFGELFDLVGDVFEVGGAVGAVGRLQDELAHALHLGVDRGERAGGGVHPGEPVLGTLFVGGEPVDGALQVDDLAGAVGVVGGFEDRLAGGEFGLGAGQGDLGGVDVGRAWS